MTIIESPKTHHPLGEIPSQSSAPILRAQTAPIRREGSSARSSTSRGIRGIDAILRTAQDDIVGEYHNIDGKTYSNNSGHAPSIPPIFICLKTIFYLESIADINVTTLKLSLPREEIMPTNFETKRPELDSITSNYNFLSEARYEHI